MAVLNVPIPDGPDAVARVNLDGVVYDFRFRWNSRSECWYLYIGPTGEDYTMKVKLLTGQELLKPYKYKPSSPQGDLMLIDTLKLYGRAGRDNLGQNKRFRLIYIEEGTDVDALIKEAE